MSYFLSQDHSLLHLPFNTNFSITPQDYGQRVNTAQQGCDLTRFISLTLSAPSHCEAHSPREALSHPKHFKPSSHLCPCDVGVIAKLTDLRGRYHRNTDTDTSLGWHGGCRLGTATASPERSFPAVLCHKAASFAPLLTPQPTTATTMGQPSFMLAPGSESRCPPPCTVTNCITRAEKAIGNLS